MRRGLPTAEFERMVSAALTCRVDDSSPSPSRSAGGVRSPASPAVFTFREAPHARGRDARRGGGSGSRGASVDVSRSRSPGVRAMDAAAESPALRSRAGLAETASEEPHEQQAASASAKARARRQRRLEAHSRRFGRPLSPGRTANGVQYTPVLNPETMHAAIAAADTDAVRSGLLSRVVDPARHTEPSTGYSLLHLACAVASADIVTLLLEQVPQPDPSQRSSVATFCVTPLHIVAQQELLTRAQCRSLVLPLLRAGCDPSVKDSTGNTCLHVAAQRCSLGFVRCMCDLATGEVSYESVAAALWTTNDKRMLPKAVAARQATIRAREVTVRTTTPRAAVELCDVLSDTTDAVKSAASEHTQRREEELKQQRAARRQELWSRQKQQLEADSEVMSDDSEDERCVQAEVDRMAREQRAVRLAVAETESSWEMRHGDSTGVHVVAGLIGERLTRRLLHDPALPLPKDMTVIDAAYLSAKRRLMRGDVERAVKVAREAFRVDHPPAYACPSCSAAFGIVRQLREHVCAAASSKMQPRSRSADGTKRHRK